ncbi:hypothetical protein TSUD_368690 [Trifolium subterraneum]|uniref:Uncharacterized protein n=1 Tax=Trifolium subterraneum TaxID=3900 RepID=A0A2Z6P5E5_TRISU|nr:hypothetical protein TSUD_368690 [Trifolium subterraneum]
MVEAQQKEEIEAKNHAIKEVHAQQQEETEAMTDEIIVQSTENCEAVPISADQEIASVQDQATFSSKIDIHVLHCQMPLLQMMKIQKL